MRALLPLLALILAGCGGATATVENAFVNYETEGGPLEVIVTRDSQMPDEAVQPCTLTSQPEWCGLSLQQFRFRVQPSYVLYRVYARAPASTGGVIRVRVRKGERFREVLTTVGPGATRLLFEIGTASLEPRA